VRAGAVELLPSGDVRLREQAHIPAGAVEGKLTLLGSDPAEVFATIIHNIEHPDAPRLQRKVAYDNIGAEALPELRVKASQLGEEFIRRANTLLASYDRDRNPQAPAGTPVRVVLGAYFFENEVAAGHPPEPGEPPRKRGRSRRSR
jgi:hypothetical protein